MAYYKDAQQDCQNQGANLASFHSLADADALWRGNLVYVILHRNFLLAGIFKKFLKFNISFDCVVML